MRPQKSRASTVLLAVVGVLVLVGAILIGRTVFTGAPTTGPPSPS